MKYTEEHEWLLPEDDLITVGITAHAAEQLGEEVYVELPEPGTEITAGSKTLGVLAGVRGARGLGKIRLDRVADAIAAGEAMRAGDVDIALIEPDWLGIPLPGRI